MRRRVGAAALVTGVVACLLPIGAPPVRAQDAAAPAETPEKTALPKPDEEALEFRARRARAAALAGKDAVLLVLAEGAAAGFTGKKRSDDFFYLSPVRAANAALVVFTDGDEVRDRIYLPPRNRARERWDGEVTGPGQETAARHAFDAAPSTDALAADLAGLLVGRRALVVSASAPADGARRLDALAAKLNERLPEGAELLRLDRRRRGERPETEGKAGPVVRSAGSLIGRLRMAKSPREIAHIRRAVESTVDGIMDALRTAEPGLGEYQLQAIVELHCRLRGCERQAFPSIVGSGPNSCVLHYLENRRTMQDGDIVVMDVGGEYRGYAADVTRSFPVSGRFSAEQARVYDAVLEAQEAGLAEVRPGSTLRKVHDAARAVLAKHGLAQYFFHGTSHSVGLNVHDVWRREWEFVPGTVLTVEPGAYIADDALGIRIEDTVVVTAEGCEILSARAPKKRAEIEALMKEPPPLDVR